MSSSLLYFYLPGNFTKQLPIVELKIDYVFSRKLENFRSSLYRDINATEGRRKKGGKQKQKTPTTTTKTKNKNGGRKEKKRGGGGGGNQGQECTSFSFCDLYAELRTSKFIFVTSRILMTSKVSGKDRLTNSVSDADNL